MQQPSLALQVTAFDSSGITVANIMQAPGLNWLTSTVNLQCMSYKPSMFFNIPNNQNVTPELIHNMAISTKNLK